MKLARLSLGVAGAAYLGFGVVLLVQPDMLGLAGVAAASPAGRVELRAFYGGIEIGLGIFLLLALSRETWHRPALLVQVLTLGGVAAARLVGLLLDPTTEPAILGAFPLEAGGALLGIAALRQLARRT